MDTADKKPAPVANAKPAEKSDDRHTFLGRLKDAWKDSVGAYATDEGATKNLFSRLVDFGHLSREEALKLVGESRAKIEQNKKELERRVDESIHRATARLSPPSAGDIEKIARDLDAIERRIAAVEAKRKARAG